MDAGGARKRAKLKPQTSKLLENISGASGGEVEAVPSSNPGLSVLTVILFLTLLFVVIFFATYFALGSAGVGNDSLAVLLANLKASDFDRRQFTASPTSTQPTARKLEARSEPLTKPTILWWTEKLFPHFQGKDTVGIECGLGSCLTTTDKTVLSDNLAQIILFYGTDFRAYEAPLPRESWHEWALIHEESPLNNQIFSHEAAMSLFNHTSTVSRESDFPLSTQHIPTIQYLTNRKPVDIKRKNSNRDKLAPILYVQTHCNVPSDRDRYVKELMKHIDVDSYGKCLNNKELPHNLQDPVESMDSPAFLDFIARYKFHLAFENGICEDYMTEKLFRPLHVGSVPIYRGSPGVNDWMPNDHSIILADDFKSPKELAEFIKQLDNNDNEYMPYLEFKETRSIENERLRYAMENRIWGVNEWRLPSFINAFECYLCDRMHERSDAEQKHQEDPTQPLQPVRVAGVKHAECPEPTVSFGDISQAGRSEDIHFWIEDYWSSRDQALALTRMILKGATDSSKLFDELQQMFNEK